jgi:3-(3-hydroxy-phenyl)propionate hydroxylase
VPRQQLIPPLEAGLLSPAPHAANGTLFPQPRVRVGDRTALLDDLAGTGFRVVMNQRLDAVAAKRHPGIARLDARVVRIGDADAVQETDDVVAAWFRRHGCTAALVRPDHYVFGVASTDAELGALLDAAAAQAAVEPVASR